MSATGLDIPPGYAPLRPAHSGNDGHLQHLGPFYTRDIDGGLCVAVRLQAHHCNPFEEAHGGFVATLADIVLGACLLHSPGHPASVTTLSLNVEYLDSSRIGDWLEAHGRPDRVGRSIAFVSADLVVGSRRVAQAHGVFKVLSEESMLRRQARSGR